MSVEKKIFKYLTYTVLGLIVFIVFVRTFNGFYIKSSSEYDLAKQFIVKSDTIKAELGKVTGYGFLPRGKVTKKSAQIETTVQGTKNKAFVIVLMERENDNASWRYKRIVIKKT